MSRMTDASPTDRRRDAGARTKQRLLDATLALLAERGEDAVTLRDITAAAQTNVASVSYHFGSLGALCCSTAKQAITRLLDEQMTRLQALGDDATVEQIARAIAQPVIGVLSEPHGPSARCCASSTARWARRPASCRSGCAGRSRASTAS